MTDGRKLSVRIASLAARFRAQAIGHRKYAAKSAQDAENADRDAGWLEEAVKIIEKAKL